jgi:hypothetical protein
MSEPVTTTLVVPGATLRYDVRQSETAAPLLMMIGAPMDAGAFTTLATHFRDRTGAPHDPRGVARHPEQVRTLVAHEPPLATVLPDREDALAAVVAVHETYLRAGFGPAMAKFIALTMVKGPIPAEFPERRLDPAAFGLPTEDDGARNHPLLGPHIVNVTHYEPDFDALRAAPTRIVAAAGSQSEGGFTYRAALAVAERLGSEAAIFPSHHAGFAGAEVPQPGEPEAFAARLREVLGEDD